MPVLPGITIRLNDAPAESETIGAVVVVPHVLVITTTIAEHGISLSSTYVGHPALRTYVTHLVLTPKRSFVNQAQLPHNEVPVVHARERCLLEHATALQDAAGAHVDLADAALLAAGHL